MNRRRMASVLRIRQIQERSARGAMATARTREREAVEAEQATWQQLDARAAAGATVPAQPAALAAAARVTVEAGIRAASTQHALAERFAVETVAASEQWTVAARRVEGLQRLAERARVAELEERARLASNEVDDLVLVRFAEQVA